MTFLNPILLAGLALTALPVLLHLLNRGRTRPVAWGAMEFLRRSIAMRTRRIRFEEALLLALRCLLVALPALAMARPFLPRRGFVPGAVLLLFVLAAGFLGAAGAWWAQRRTRLWLLAAAAALLVAGMMATSVERWLQSRRWAFDGGARDWVFILDGSSAMALPFAEGRSGFDHAWTEARSLAERLRPGDTLAVFIGAAVPVPLLPRPTADRNEIAAALPETPPRLPPGGPFGVSEALNAAVQALAAGRHPAKTLVVFGAGDRQGWTAEEGVPWQFTLDRMDALLPARPDVIYRRFLRPPETEIRNLAVGMPVLSRRLADTARPIRIESTIWNTGNRALSPGRIELRVNGERVEERQVAADVPAGATESVVFSHRFSAPGPHVVTVALAAQDDLASDNEASRVAQVLDRLPVLVVDGAPTRRRRGATAFLRTALAPPPDEDESVLRRIWAFTRGLGDRDESPVADTPATDVTNLVRPDIRPVSEIGTVDDLDRYRAVILVDVPMLPAAFAARLAEHVRAGHGLLLLPGEQSQPEHFDVWRSNAGEPILPAAPGERLLLKRTPTGLQMPSLTHPAFQLLAKDRHSDIESLRVYACRPLTPDPDDPNVRTAGVLRNGVPFMLERSFGKGSVLMPSFLFNREDSNLPSLKAFVPLVHETLYYLVGASLPDDNTRPGMAFSTWLPFESSNQDGKRRPRTGPQPEPLEVETLSPSGRVLASRLMPAPDGVVVLCTDTVEAGVYQVSLPEDLAGRVVSNRLAGARLPFAVMPDPRSSRVDPIGENDVRWISGNVTFNLADSEEDLPMILSEQVPGRALWPWLLLAALLVVPVEIAVSRQITAGRQVRATDSIAFDTGTSDNSAFENRIKAWFPTQKRM